ncbi:MAG: hypothetical protein ABL986_17370 [Vicinamibacterales bacterium]
MRSDTFRRIARVTAWVILSWVAVDLGAPSVCALDQDELFASIASTRVQAAGQDTGTEGAAGHVDDCFCCSHCVDVSLLSVATAPPLADARLVLPLALAPLSSAFPPYHPPRA